MKIAIIGAGTVGAALTKVLCSQESVSTVIVMDKNGTVLNSLSDEIDSKKLRTFRVGLEKEIAVESLTKGFDCLISALPYEYNSRIAKIAVKRGIHFIDFGANDAVFEKQMQLHEAAKEKEIHIIPNCGLAPGLVNIIALQAYEEFDSVDKIQIRAAGLPVNPEPPLNYHLSFSPAGLINEYMGKALVIRNGKAEYVNTLEGHEEVKFSNKPDIGELEAFYTSGQITTLARYLEGKLNTLEFKTVRYAGHRNIIKSLFELGFDSDSLIDIRSSMTYRNLLIRQLLRKLPQNDKDIALVKLKITGEKDGKTIRRVYEITENYNTKYNISAMMFTTVIPVVAMAELMHEKKLDQQFGAQPPELALSDKKEFINKVIQKGLEINVREEELSEKAHS